MSTELQLIKCVEDAAMQVYPYIGKGPKYKEFADKQATEAIRIRLNKLNISGKVVIGEGQKDNSYGLFKGETFGGGHLEYDCAVDPLEGTVATVLNKPGAMSVIALADKDCIYDGEEYYSLKLAYGPQIANRLHKECLLNCHLRYIISRSANYLNKRQNDLMVCILDRPRHQRVIDYLRSLGVKLKIIQDCDVTGAIATCLSSSQVDLLFGIGGTPEAVLAAAAIKCLKGGLECVPWDLKDSPELDVLPQLSLPLMANDLVRGDCAFACTGITSGSLLRGVRYTDKFITHSLAMRSKSGTVRYIETEHGN